MNVSTLASAGTPARVSFVALSLLLLSAGSTAAEPSADGVAVTASWVAKYQDYAAQEGLQNDRPYASGPVPALRWNDLLQGLPAPEEWPALKNEMMEIAAKQAEGASRERLLAGVWLLSYLTEGKEAVLASLPPAPEAIEQATPRAYALANLRQILAAPELEETSLELQVKQFEQQLLMFEPVDIEAVKRAIGGEENFARVQRLIAASKASQARAQEIFAEYEKTKDEATARRKMEALQSEFEEAHGADQQALEPYQNEPLLGRYMASVFQSEMPMDYAPTLSLPDLVTALGPDKAEAMLRRALRLPVKLGLQKSSGEATSKLVRELALVELTALKAPSWGLAHDMGSVALFEGLQKRFGVPGEQDYEYQQAQGYYLIALIQLGRVADAVKLAGTSGRTGSLNLPYEVLTALEKSGQAEALWQFLREWLMRHPAAGEWDRFNRLSAQLDRQAELKALIKTLAESGAFDGLDRLRVQRMQADAELAADELAAGQHRLQALIATPAETVEELAVQMEVAEKLVQLADLQGNQTEATEGLIAAEGVLAKCRTLKPEKSIDLAATLSRVLNQLERFAEAERVSRDALRVASDLKMAPASAEDRQYQPVYMTRGLAAEQLRALVGLERWNDAAQLLQEGMWWGAADVSGLLHEMVGSDRRPLGWHCAQVALKQSRPEQARKILEAQLVATPGIDAVYESYLALIGQKARPLLATLAASDRYEERPLIWLARLQLDAQELDQAVASLENAITIDPSDGEEGRGDRMRVYALMARAMALRGDQTKANFFEGVVKAIRLSETADRWFDAGAYARAIRLYRESLGFFQDAYCIQSRLAVRLAAEGKMDEAAGHYRRAFELMPDSFGRVESHCFGCEHVFAGEKSQGVAEDVFVRMLAARPDKPQLHYLLGYLRQEQKRLPEAAEHYRQAVALDPLYLNAWNKLAGLERELKLTPQQRDDLNLKLLELDPARRHTSPSLERVADLSRLWRGLLAARLALAGLPSTEKLGELKASSAEVSSSDDSYAMWGRQSLLPNFGSVLGEHRFVQGLQQYLAVLNAPEMEN